MTPSTFDRAVEFLARGAAPRFGRLLYAEAGSQPATAWETAPRTARRARRALVVVGVDRLDAGVAGRLDLADGEILLQRRPDGEGLRRERTERTREQNRLVEALHPEAPGSARRPGRIIDRP